MKIKSTLLLVTLLCGVTSLFAQQGPFVLKGKIKGQESGFLKLYYTDATGKQITDSAAIQNGSFEFKGDVNGPVMVYFAGAVKSLAMGDPNSTNFFIEPGNLSMEVTAGDFRNLKLKGSKTQDEVTALDLRKKAQMDQIRILSAAYDKANMTYIDAKKAGKPEAELEALKEAATAAKDKMDPLRSETNKIDMEFIKTHPDSYYTAYMLRYRVSSLPLAESKQLYAKLSDRVKQSSYGKEIAKEIKSLEGGSPGSIANVFSTIDINGTPISLADYKGKKYVLLDFWASWCVPCRKGNPHLLSLYRKYKDKGFEIIGVSDDDSNHEAWKKAVAQDQIGVWRHVLRGLKRVGNTFDKSTDITEPYAIHSLPTKILIDKNGVIIGRYGGGGENDEAMDKKLAEIFDNLTSSTAMAQTNNGFTLTGTVKGIADGDLKLTTSDSRTRTTKTIGSAKVKNGKFVATGKLNTAEMIGLTFTPGNWSTSVLLENKAIHIAIDTTGAQHFDYTKYGMEKGAILKQVQVTGSASHTAYQDYEASFKGAKGREEVFAAQLNYIRSYIAKNPSSVAGVYMLSNHLMFNSSLPVNDLEQMTAQFTEPAKQSSYFISLQKEVDERKAILPGNYAEDFTLMKPDSSKMTLSSTRGKYVMIDFWASWCVPCREAIPHWKEVYAKYKNRGFEIIGITNDSRWGDWKKALAEENMPWIQLADEFPVKNMPARVISKYKHGTIPLYVLLDKEGKILVKTGDKKEIDNKLKELLGD